MTPSLSMSNLDQAAERSLVSPRQADFFDFVRRNPEALERSSFEHLARPDGDERVRTFLSHIVPVHPWPMFVDPGRFADFGRVAVRAFDIARTVPERFFDNDPERLCEFYALDPDLAPVLGRILDLPWRAGGEPMRGDFVYSGGEMVCLEVNATGNAGGIFNHQVVESRLREPLLRRFFAEQGWTVRFRDPWRQLLRMMIERAVDRGLHAAGRLDLAITMHVPDVFDAALPVIEPQYVDLLTHIAPGVEGRLVFCDKSQLARRNGGLVAAGVPVQVVLQGQQNYSDVLMGEDDPLLGSWLDGTIDLYPGPLNWVYSDKRNLALISSRTDLYDRDETAWIEKHLPWSRLVEPGQVTYEGSSIDLEKLLRAERENLVLKPAQSASGIGIYIGLHADAAQWDELVDSALEFPGTYMVQRRVESDLQLHQWGPSGAEFCDINWGLFVAGDRFGGAYLRLCPPTPDGIINVGHGAEDGAVLELLGPGEDVGASPVERVWEFGG